MDRKTNNRNVQEAAAQRKATNDTQYFWDLVNRHLNGQNVGPRKYPKQHDEHHLFGKKVEHTPVSGGTVDDSISVQRSGPQSDDIASIDSFQQLESLVPPSVLKCFEMLHFDRPTPIQKHAVPLGLAGLDLMCCAQTVSDYS
jgi:hypothetical protein